MEVIKHGALKRLAAPACMLALAAGTVVCGAAAYGPGFWARCGRLGRWVCRFARRRHESGTGSGRRRTGSAAHTGHSAGKTFLPRGRRKAALRPGPASRPKRRRARSPQKTRKAPRKAARSWRWTSSTCRRATFPMACCRLFTSFTRRALATGISPAGTPPFATPPAAGQ